jgi:uncharacterized protein YcaQ
MYKKGKLRRIALNQQGLLKTNSFGRGKPATLRAIEHLGYIQIDTISVVERAHHHVLWSRIANYQPKFLSQLIAERNVFEYWFHAAAWLPMRDYRFALPRMQAMKDGEHHWGQNSSKQLMQDILIRIRHEGPLRARDFEDTRTGKKKWWDWKPAKRALEQLFMQGDLMVSGRKGFQKIYDLPERVLPDHVDMKQPTRSEYANYLIDTSLRANGFATQESITYLRTGQPLKNAIVDELNARVDARLLTTIKLSDSSIAYIDPDLLESRAPRSSALVRILSPFDNAVIQRNRVRDLFTFNYKIECYVPAPKRKFGYFCLPILYRDRLVGRIDCKAHRKEKRLEVKALHIEKKVDTHFPDRMNAAMVVFAQFNQCDEISPFNKDLDALLH